MGYQTLTADGKIEALVKDGEEVSSAKSGEVITLIVNQTPFYGESGGQVGDTGTLSTPSGRMELEDTQRKGDLIVHSGRITEGNIKQGDLAHLEVNGERRTFLKANHSATHLLHKALRECLGPHVTQKGSLVSPDRLRFDFSHPKPLTAEELTRIEQQVNAQIRQNTPVTTCLMSQEEATRKGALALFGEKYGNEVRVVSMGEDSKAPFSVELCGGTHVNRTGDIGYFKLLSEVGVAAGVRRIEALTGPQAEQFAATLSKTIGDLAGILKVTPPALFQRATELVENSRILEKEVKTLRRRLATAGEEQDLKPDIINGIPLYCRHVKDAPPQTLKSIVDDLKTKFSSGLFVVVGENEGKVSLVIGVSQDLLDRFNAIDLIQKVVHFIGGKGGGGRPDLAQAGGNQPDGIVTLFKEFPGIL